MFFSPEVGKTGSPEVLFYLIYILNVQRMTYNPQPTTRHTQPLQWSLPRAKEGTVKGN